MNQGSDAILLAAAITSGATLLAALGSLIVYICTAIGRRRTAKADARRRASERILDAVDRFAREQRKPAIWAYWSTATVDIALAQNRILLDVPKGNNHLWIWLKARTEEMVDKSAKRSPLEIAFEISGAVTEWNRGGLKDDWFTKANVRENNVL